MGTPLELYDSPANMFVAGFIGSPSMNFMNREIMAEGFRTDDGVVLPLVGKVSVGTERGVYGVRPEHLRLDPDGIAAKLIVVEPTGSETMVVTKLVSNRSSAFSGTHYLPARGDDPDHPGRRCDSSVPRRRRSHPVRRARGVSGQRILARALSIVASRKQYSRRRNGRSNPTDQRAAARREFAAALPAAVADLSPGSHKRGPGRKRRARQT